MELGPFEFDRIKRLGAFEKDLAIDLHAAYLILCLPEREKVERVKIKAKTELL